jgi:hypothetical protein
MLRVTLSFCFTAAFFNLFAQQKDGFSAIAQSGVIFYGLPPKIAISHHKNYLKRFEIPTQISYEYKYNRFVLGAGFRATYVYNYEKRDTTSALCWQREVFLDKNLAGLDFTQQRVDLSFPFYVNYFILNKKRFSAFVQAGLRPEFTFYFKYNGLFHYCKSYNDMSYDQPPVRVDTEFTETRYSGIDVLFGLGANYHFKDGKALRLTFNFSEKYTALLGLQVPLMRKE